MGKEFDIKEAAVKPENGEALAWQDTYSSIAGADQFKRWKNEPFEMATLSTTLENLDTGTTQMLGNGVWNINKATPLKMGCDYVAIGGWCTFSEGDTTKIYQGKLPDGSPIGTPADIARFLGNYGNRFEQVVRCVGPVGNSAGKDIPYLVVVEDSLWAERIAARLGKPGWKDELTGIFKDNAKKVSEPMVAKWLSLATGKNRQDVYFFYTSDIEEYLGEAVTKFTDQMDYENQKKTVQNMPVLVMYTGFWLDAIKNIKTFQNGYQTYEVPEKAKGLVTEVDSHFRLRGKEMDLVGPFFWSNRIGEGNNTTNPNKNIYAAGFYQQRNVLVNQKLTPAYTLPYDQVLNTGNIEVFLGNLYEGLEQAAAKGKVYPFCNPIALEALSVLSWMPEARTLLEKLTQLPKEKVGIKTNSAKPVDSAYSDEAVDILYKLFQDLQNVYTYIGY